MSKIITIGREFGSGGRELGRRLSEKLGYAYYDQEIIAEIAKRTALSEEYVQQIIERKPITSFPIHIGHSFYPVTNPMFQQSLNVYAEQHKLLQEMAAKSDCIIVGRCADYILRDSADCLRVFICSDMESRARRIVEQYGERSDSPEKRLKDKDKRRAAYYQFYTDMKWGDVQNCHIALNSGLLGIDRCVDILVSLY